MVHRDRARSSPPGWSTERKRPIPVEGRAFDLGGDTGNRTPDLLLAKQALYQLSYVPEGMFSCAEPR